MIKNNGKFKRKLGLCECITITVGTVIGVGLFTVGANVVGILGPAVMLATLVSLLISIYPSMLYAEMASVIPYSGGTYTYAVIGLGRPAGMLAGWNFIISTVAVSSAEAMAFSFYIRTLLNELNIDLHLSDRFIACAIILIFTLLNVFGVGLTGKLQNGFMFFFWGITAIWIFNMIPNLNIGNFSSNYQPWNVSLESFLKCTAMVWWCFAGFETCSAMGGEVKKPKVNIPRALLLSPFIVYIVNSLFQWVLICIVPKAELSAIADAAAPYAEGMKLAGLIGFPLILLCLGITFGGDFSTLNAGISAQARYLYKMSSDGAVPLIFSKIHTKFGTPYISALFLGMIMLLLVSTGSIIYIASLSLFSTLLYYIIGMLSAWGLRFRYPKIERPYKAPVIKVFLPVSLVIYLFMMTFLDYGAIILGILWSVCGILIYFFYSKKHFRQPQLIDEKYVRTGVKNKPNREYKIISIIVYLLAFAVFLLFIISCFFN